MAKHLFKIFNSIINLRLQATGFKLNKQRYK